ncbi:hypothetical protein [Novosphingobium humi]|uniref:DUF5983 domain-containing protein n=1 Tax=Novosphingobium humi TaxID=2282397 RepID=A0ABY7U0P0_9SPHN|nr:hypothetical protein [Novosphingobium humi]WCT79096.1 hypothetical protein PQ457_18965 [Novosphingobium humi]
MRLAKYCVCSTAHLPAAERRAFDCLFATAPRRAGRLIVDHDVLSIEAHQYGFANHLGFFDDYPDRPDDVSATFWALLTLARSCGADWLSFDRDEPPMADLPVDPEDEEGEGMAQPKIVLCGQCRGDNLICDAAARWDKEAQGWVVEAVFGEAWCDTCGDTHWLEVSGTGLPDGQEASHA